GGRPRRDVVRHWRRQDLVHGDGGNRLRGSLPPSSVPRSDRRLPHRLEFGKCAHWQSIPFRSCFVCQRLGWTVVVECRALPGGLPIAKRKESGIPAERRAVAPLRSSVAHGTLVLVGC